MQTAEALPTKPQRQKTGISTKVHRDGSLERIVLFLFYRSHASSDSNKAAKGRVRIQRYFLGTINGLDGDNNSKTYYSISER